MHGPQARRIATHNHIEILQGAQHHTRLASQGGGRAGQSPLYKEAQAQAAAEQLVELKEDLS